MPLAIQSTITESLPDQAVDTDRTTLLIDVQVPRGSQTPEQATASFQALKNYIDEIVSINGVTDPEIVHVRIQSTTTTGDATTTTGWDGTDPENGTNPPA